MENAGILAFRLADCDNVDGFDVSPVLPASEQIATGKHS